jgi:hypothetical protein
MSGQNENKTTLRKYIGYVLVAIKGFIGGYDDGTDTVRLPYRLNKLTMTPSIFLPIILPFAVAYGVLRASKAVWDEQDLNKEDQAKEKELAQLLKELEQLRQEVLQSKEPFKAKIIRELEQQSLAENELESGAVLPSNRILLKGLIDLYGIDKCCLDKKILRLIKTVVGLDPRSASFKGDLQNFLKDYNDRDKNPLRAIPKRILEFINQFRITASIAASLLILFTASIVSIPATWPFIAIIVGCGIAYWTVNFIYHRYYQRSRKKLDKEIAEKQATVELLQKILEKPVSANDTNPNQVVSNAPVPKDTYFENSLSMSQKIRMGLNVTGDFILFLAISLSGGMTLAYLADIFLAATTVISYPALSGIIGAGLAAFSIYYWIKKRVQEIRAESALTKEVAASKQELKELGSQLQSENFENDIKKNNQALLIELIEIYNSGRVDQSKKFVRLIQRSIGMKSSEGNFFDALTEYLKKAIDRKDNEVDRKDDEILVRVKQLKDKLEQNGIQIASGDNPENVSENRFKAFFGWFMNHTLPLIGIITLGLLLPILLFGPQALLLIGVMAGVVTAGYILDKVASHYHQKKMTELTEEKIKYELMEYKYEIQTANPIPNSADNSTPPPVEPDVRNQKTKQVVITAGTSIIKMVARGLSKMFRNSKAQPGPGPTIQPAEPSGADNQGVFSRIFLKHLQRIFQKQSSKPTTSKGASDTQDHAIPEQVTPGPEGTPTPTQNNGK